MKKVDETKDKNPLKMPDGTVIDLSAFDWGKEKLNEKQKLFVFWFSLPGTDYYHRGMKAARKAGYTANTAHVAAHKMRRDPKIEALIKRFEDTIGKMDLIDAADRYVHEKIIRAEYDIKDFYELVEYTDSVTGQPRKKLMLKNLETLTPEQRLCIDGIDIKGQQGIPVYILADRQKERDSIISLVKKDAANTSDEEFDVETTAELIKGNLQVKTKLIKRNQAILDDAPGFVDAPKHIIEEE